MVKKKTNPSSSAGRRTSEGCGKKETFPFARRFGVVEEKISREEFLVLEKRVLALEKSKR